MSLKGIRRVFPLLMAVLMITTAFIPAVSAAGTNRSGPDTDTGTSLFSSGTESRPNTTVPAAAQTPGSHGNGKDHVPSAIGPKNWAQLASAENASGSVAEGEPVIYGPST